MVSQAGYDNLYLSDQLSVNVFLPDVSDVTNLAKHHHHIVDLIAAVLKSVVRRHTLRIKFTEPHSPTDLFQSPHVHVVAERREFADLNSFLSQPVLDRTHHNSVEARRIGPDVADSVAPHHLGDITEQILFGNTFLRMTHPSNRILGHPPLDRLRIDGPSFHDLRKDINVKDLLLENKIFHWLSVENIAETDHSDLKHDTCRPRVERLKVDHHVVCHWLPLALPCHYPVAATGRGARGLAGLPRYPTTCPRLRACSGLKCSLQQRLQMFRRARSISCLEEICRLVVHCLPLSFSDASTTVFRSFNLNDILSFDHESISIHTDILET